jgi:tetratricopeptide (TPR) repeat protein
VVVGVALACVVPTASGQSRQYELDPTREWREQAAPAVGSDRWTVAEARRLIVDGQEDRAERLLTRWLRENEGRTEDIVAEALLARGDARVADGDEFSALYDYERLLREYPDSAAFERAVERELEIAIAYAGGLKRKLFGVRLLDTDDIAIELLIRTQERMPGSAMAERAAIELADFFYQRRDIELAGESYGLYLENFPDGPSSQRAARRQIYTDIARFKGPRYDASMLLDAKVRIGRFMERFPADAERRGINEGLVDRLDESLAAQLLESAEWYVQVGQDASARLVLRRLVDRYPNTMSAAAARDMLRRRGWDRVESGGDGDESAGESADRAAESAGGARDMVDEASAGAADDGADDAGERGADAARDEPSGEPLGGEETDAGRG